MLTGPTSEELGWWPVLPVFVGVPEETQLAAYVTFVENGLAF